MGFAFCAVIYGVAYLWGASGEAFQYVERKIKASSAIELKVGQVKQISLDPVGGYREKFVNANKTAYMAVNVIGDKGKVTIKIVAKKADGAWEVREASTDGQSIDLDSP